MVHITLQLPEDIAARLANQWNDLPRVALESLAVDAYRAQLLTAAKYSAC